MTGLVGTGSLVRLALRRDRVLIPVWVAVFALMAYSSALAVDGLYPNVADRVRASNSFNGTGSLVALYGRIYDPTSIGALAMLKLGGLGSALVGVLSANLVVRHTRADEETGRAELIGATVVGRSAPLTAAVVIAIGTSIVLGGATALALWAAGLPIAGSLAFGLSWAAAGIAFGGLAATFAQLGRAARTATTLTAVALVVSYLVRALADTSPTRRSLTWLSPIGWSQQIRPFAGDRFAVSLLLLALGAVATAAAMVLTAGRDLGGGLIGERPGRAHAGRLLASPAALAWRLHRGTVLAWFVAAALMGAVLGAMANDVSGLLDSPAARAMIEALGGKKALTDAFLAAELGFSGIFAAAFAVQALHRLHEEDAAMHTELVLSAPVSRTRWLLAHLGVALGGAAALLALAGLGAGIAHATTTGDRSQVLRVLAGAGVQLPAVLVIAGAAVVGYGWLPRFSMLGWSVLVTALLLGEFGAVFDLPQAIIDLSPFGHVPALPGSRADPVPLAAMVGVGAALTLAGLAGLRRRDVVG